MQTNPKISQLTIPKQYYQTRMSLTNSMHLFFLYDSSDKESTSYWNDFLNTLLEEFPTYLNISLVEKTPDTNADIIKLFWEGDISNLKYPSIILAHPHLTEPQIVNGITPVDLYSLVEKFNSFYINDFDNEKKEMFSKIKLILDEYPMVVFIKGTPQDPYCKFSRTFIELLNSCKVRYKAIDIFQDEKLRCYLRLYSGWKTYPQLYINGNIIGGVDKLTELINANEFMKMVPKEVTYEYLKENITKKINESKEVVVVLNENDINKEEGEIIDIGKDLRIKEIMEKEFNIKEYPIKFKEGKVVEMNVK